MSKVYRAFVETHVLIIFMLQEFPVLRIGVIADPQFALLPPHPTLDRHYARSLEKLSEAVECFNTMPLDVVVVLGDLIDREFENFAPVLAQLDHLRHPRILLPGNHDFAVAPERLTDIHQVLCMPAPYYSQSINGIRLIVTDGNEVSLFAPPEGDPRRIEAQARLAALKAADAVNAMDWNAGMSRRQTEWLAQQLRDAEAAGETVIVLGHYPIYPPSDHNLWQSEEIAGMLAASPATIAYLCGHFHSGNYGLLGGTHFVNFCGMVDTEFDNAFAVLDLYPDRIEIEGFGREQSRRLPL
ncbi:3',5'-cyclic adenosine monophosphate phosphodiesterase CpdA [Rhizobium sp. CECT 9324]|nr:3',5'-cyclic adenosine monophosphate phosphodiesterase CpdA [Rhizobium sp. CECT 9324]